MSLATSERAIERVREAWTQGIRPTPAVWRLRLVVVSAVLALLAFVQQPRYVARDTKLDLYVDPVDFMRRATSLWDPRSGFGELANQAYGYLFPMGPYYAVTQLLQMPDWVAQRLWQSGLLVVGFLGVVKLAGLLDVGRPWARVLAGVAFVLSPRMVTVLGPISSEALPFALTPWVLVPLVRYYAAPRKAAALSAIAVLAAGGVNATATAALLPLPVLYLLTREAGPHRRRLALWWLGCLGLATFWWVVPLVLLGAYSFPFLDYIESATVTTSVTSLTEVLRGNSHWINHFEVAGQPWWRGGALLTSAPFLYVVTLVVAGLGLAGLAARGMRERAFLVLGLVAGLVLVGLGYAGPAGGPLAGLTVELLDGPLAPLRNVHKFDAVLRLPLVLGLAHLVSRGTPLALRPSISAAACCAVLGASYPFVATSALPDGGYLAVPGYWQEAADWLAEEGPLDRSLVVPASGFGQYVWGRPMDEPLQPLARAPWAIRNQIPLSSEGNIRMLDAVESRIADGEGSPALAAFLARNGVRFVVVRNDLDWPWTGSARPVVVHQALERAGLAPVQAFGPGVAANRSAAQQVSDRGADPLYPAIQVYEVPGYDAPVRAVSESSAVRLTGGPEAELLATEAGLLDGQVALLDGDPEGGSAAPVVVTDGMRLRERNMGEVVDNGSETLERGRAWVTRRAAHDYLPFPGIRRSVATWPDGARASASTSGSDADALVPRGSEHHPGAAVDGNPESAWASGSVIDPLGQWWELRFDEPTVLGAITVRLADLRFFGTDVTELALKTDAGSVRVSPNDGVASAVLPTEPTRSLQISVSDSRLSGPQPGPWGIAEVELGPGTTPVSRSIMAAPPVDSTTTAIVLRRAPGDRSACVQTLTHAACSPALASLGEEQGRFDRVLRTGTLLAPAVRGTVVPQAGPALDRLLDTLQGPAGVRLTASSRLTTEPATRPGAALDGSPATGWIASPADDDPALVLDFSARRTVSRLRFTLPADFEASRPREIVLEAAGETRRARVGKDGRVSFAPVTASRLTLRFPDPDPVFSTNPTAADALEILPVGVAELEVDHLPAARSRLDRTWTASCTGPVLQVDGVPVRTAVSGAVGDLAQRKEMAWQPCDAPREALGPGRHRVLGEPTELFRIESVSVVDSARPLPQVVDRDVEVRDWGSTRRVVDVEPGVDGEGSVLVVAENFNPGWTARAGGRDLRPVRVSGWQQGFHLPPGARTVTLEFAPNHLYRAGLLVGALLVLPLLLLAVLPARGHARRAPAPSRGAWRLAAGAGCLALVLLTGWWAVPLAAVAWALVRVSSPGDRSVAVPALLAGGSITLVAGIGLVGGRTGDWGPFGSAAQLLVALGVTAVLASVLATGRRSPAE